MQKIRKQQNKNLEISDEVIKLAAEKLEKAFEYFNDKFAMTDLSSKDFEAERQTIKKEIEQGARRTSGRII